VPTVLAILVLLVALLAGAGPAVLGLDALVVRSGSMAPAIGAGDLAIVKPTRPTELVPGDVITYRAQERPDVLVTHRLVSVDRDAQDQLRFTTRGDANNAVDQVVVDQSAVLGRVIFDVPKAGYVMDFARRTEGKIILIGVPALLLALDHVLSARKQRQGAPAGGNQVRELIARGRVAMNNGATKAAAELFDRAIAADPHLDEAWLLKASCVPRGPERLAVLRAGLTVNPESPRLKKAVEITLAAESAAG
jgi:signal peptidase I